MRKLILLVFLFFIPTQAMALNIGSLPYHQPFNSDPGSSYYNTECGSVAGACGCSITYRSSGGWDDSGYLEIDPPNSGQGAGTQGQYCRTTELDWPDDSGQTDLNTRWIVKIEENFNSTSTGSTQQVKFYEVWVGSYRGMSTWDYVPSGDTYSTSWNIEEDGQYPSDSPVQTWPTDHEKFLFKNYENQWVCFEHREDSSGNTALYIWTRDGRFNGLYASGSRAAWATLPYYIAGIGGYYNGYFTEDPENHIYLDDIYIAETAIGAPSGFVGTPIFQDDFEDGNASDDWEGSYGSFSTSSSVHQSGQYSASAPLTNGTTSDNYLEYYFGDHPLQEDAAEDELYFETFVRFSTVPGTWPSDSHKIAILDLDNATTGARTHQVILLVRPSGQFGVEYVDWATSWTGIDQNQGTPISPSANTWYRLKLYAKLNTPGSSDGVIKMWVDGTLEMEHTGLDIRGSDTMGMNQLILSTYSTPSWSGSNGTQYFDNVWLGDFDPSEGGGTQSSTTPTMNVSGRMSLSGH